MSNDFSKTEVGKFIHKCNADLSFEVILLRGEISELKDIVSGLRNVMNKLIKKKSIPLIERLGKSLIEKFDKPIRDLELTIRSVNALHAEEIMHVGQLVKHKEQELLKIPNCGRKSLNEIIDVLGVHGLKLGMDIGDWSADDVK